MSVYMQAFFFYFHNFSALRMISESKSLPVLNPGQEQFQCLISDTSFSWGGGSTAEWDGCNRPGLRGHAGAEQPAAAAVTGEGRRQFQADERANQIQPDLQAAERGEGGAGRPGSHIQNPGDG